MKNTVLLILAAGQGTRLRSSLPKVLHLLAGKPLFDYVLDASRALGPVTTYLIVGHEADKVKSHLASHSLQFVEQVPQCGTGHAVQISKPHWGAHRGHLLILSGDVPLISTVSLQKLLEAHLKGGSAATLLSACLEDPSGYGRLVRAGDGTVEKIVEDRDASAEELRLKEINAGVYCFEIRDLSEAIGELSSSNLQNEYYLTDCVSLLRKKGKRVGAVVCQDPDEVLGVNSRIELAKLEHILRHRKVKQLMLDGVTIIDPASIYVSPDVKIGQDTVLHPNVCLERGSVIGSGCQIYPNVRITHSTVEDDVIVFDSCLISESHIQAGAQIGPFAHLRNHTAIGSSARIGNFVEIKKSEIGDHSKAAHLTYLGDAEVGKNVNIGAGTITCNYDGAKKYKTVIEDNVFIGSGSQLIAPVTIRRGAYVAAGSTISEEVPEDSLAIARAKQTIKESWAKQRRESHRNKR